MKNIIDYIYNYALKLFPKKYNFYTKNQKYNLRLIIEEIIYFLKSGVTYEHYRGARKKLKFFNFFCNFYEKIKNFFTKTH